MKKAGKITIAVAVMIVCLLVTGITAGFSWSYDKEINGSEAQEGLLSQRNNLKTDLDELGNEETRLNNSIQALEEEQGILSDEDTTGDEDEQGGDEEEGETESSETVKLSEENGEQNGTEPPEKTVEQSGTDSLEENIMPAEDNDYEYDPEEYDSCVEEVQKTLNNLGNEKFYCGEADGYAGENTINAIRNYQRDMGLSKQNGRVTFELLDRLDIEYSVNTD